MFYQFGNMKYIIFKKGEIVMPVIFHEYINHCDVKIGDDWIPVSAGFCNIVQGRLKVDYESSSVSLSLKPNKTDGAVMTMLANNYSVAFFMDQNDMYYSKIDK